MIRPSHALALLFLLTSNSIVFAQVDKAVPPALFGSWTTAVAREGTQRMELTLNITRDAVGWGSSCTLIDGRSDSDSVVTPARANPGYVQILRRAGNFGTSASPCQLGILEKVLSYDLLDSDHLQMADHLGTVRVFDRVVNKATPTAIPPAAMKTADHGSGDPGTTCTVTPARVTLRLGQSAVFRAHLNKKVFEPLWSVTAMKYQGASFADGFHFSELSNPVAAKASANIIRGDEFILIRSYVAKPTSAANQETLHFLQNPGQVRETVSVNYANGREATCDFTVDLQKGENPDPVREIAAVSEFGDGRR